MIKSKWKISADDKLSWLAGLAFNVYKFKKDFQIQQKIELAWATILSNMLISHLNLLQLKLGEMVRKG